MSEMIERVARAIYEADDVWSAAFPWPTMGSSDQSPDNYRRIARAAIEAMREPTKEMVVAWDRDFSDWLNEKIEGDQYLYTAMIDAALND